MRDSLEAVDGGLPRPGRRTVLRGLAGGFAVAATTAACEDAPKELGGSSVRVERGTVSGAGFTDAHWVLARPQDDAKVPLVVALHGQGSHSGAIIGGGLRVEDVLAGLIDDGTAPFAVAAIDGGDNYWHPRDNGTDAGALVTDHLVPAVEELDVTSSTVGLIGWSMGGYGSLRLAGTLGGDRVAAVAAVSPALWHSYADVPDVAFDDEADFERYGVTDRPEDLRGIPVRIDCGTSDVFLGSAKRFADSLGSRVTTSYSPGAHTLAYWSTGVRSQLAWIAERLTG